MSDRVFRRASVTLSGAGIGIAAYLTYVHYAGLHPVCGISHGCETVQTSSYASLAGLPVALLGVVTYVLILGTLRRQGETAFLAGYILTLVGFGFSVCLTYREVFTIHAICSWCVSSAIAHPPPSRMPRGGEARHRRHAAATPDRIYGRPGARVDRHEKLVAEAAGRVEGDAVDQPRCPKRRDSAYAPASHAHRLLNGALGEA
jgi:uncharacterized membrane protein